MASQEPPKEDPHAAELSASTQYVIQAESQRKKRALAESRLKYNALVEENKRLLLDRNESERHTFEVRLAWTRWLATCCVAAWVSLLRGGELRGALFLSRRASTPAFGHSPPSRTPPQVTEYMRREILAKTTKIGQLENAFETQKKDYEAKLKALKQRLESSEASSQLRFDEMESEYLTKLDAATEDLASVNEFVALRESMDREILTMRDHNAALQRRLDDSEREEQKRLLEATANMKKEFEQKLEEVKKRCVEWGNEWLQLWRSSQPDLTQLETAGMRRTWMTAWTHQ